MIAFLLLRHFFGPVKPGSTAAIVSPVLIAGACMFWGQFRFAPRYLAARKTKAGESS